MTFSELVDTWWNWVLRNPASLTDLDGSKCAQGQPYPPPSSDVFFLAGVPTTDGTPVIRTECVAPENKFLFFPLVTYNYGIFPEVEPPPGIIRPTLVNPSINAVTALGFTFDGQPGTIPGGGTGFTFSEPETADLFAYRGQSPPGGSIFDYSATFGTNVCPTCPPDSVLPGVSDGYWLLLTPPTPGEHKIKFSADGTVISQDITFDPLTVAGCA
jgi:hypothetical protein